MRDQRREGEKQESGRKEEAREGKSSQVQKVAKNAISDVHFLTPDSGRRWLTRTVYTRNLVVHFSSLDTNHFITWKCTNILFILVVVVSISTIIDTYKL